MKKIQVTLVTLLLTGASLCAQTIGEKELNDIKGSFQKDASTKAIQNVLTNDKNIRDNALNREIQGKIDHYFKYRVKVQGITDQQSSGRCWMFTSMNVLRPASSRNTTSRDSISLTTISIFGICSRNLIFSWKT